MMEKAAQLNEFIEKLKTTTGIMENNSLNYIFAYAQ